MWPFSKKKALELPDFWWAYEEHFKEKLPENIHENIFVVLDTETTGFSLTRDRMLCIGALKLLNNTIVTKESFEVYIQQEHYDSESAEIHGILKKSKKNTISELEALKQFLVYAKSHILVGHHVMFDVNMINAALKRNGLPKLKNKTLDTESLYIRTLLISSVVQKKERYSLDDLAKKFSISRKDRHTALGDAFITAIAFLRTIEKLKPQKIKDLLR
ncbi:MAG TPA: 3'-5' exonuclease [Muricauda sp.]|uniref:3'-5' exonuclease n=1 Tax=Flagellimonas aurea TaxID=2915619 RepID=A0ABS3G2U1_9FLAO|nr:3'-5' exonuclease [Allomuricauda aurea]MAO16905.1 DNA polymerase III subunit epsilon [Allomuricauda sp.]MBO0353729.1 3'-5' exonuclease [Allomuricauda aurea]HBU79377.1 3'-5' exonuclease [Allomuricauda sp.]|tara:strand:+ start:1899 stop:2549 length:651 start_codon:yes stop_codon:yes gene_type:complete